MAAFEPYQRLGFAQDVLSAQYGGGYGTRFQEQPTQSPLQQALGAGIASAGIIGVLKRIMFLKDPVLNTVVKPKVSSKQLEETLVLVLTQIEQVTLLLKIYIESKAPTSFNVMNQGIGQGLEMKQPSAAMGMANFDDSTYHLYYNLKKKWYLKI